MLARIAGDVEAITSALRASGCDVRTAESAPLDPASTAGVDVIVADIGIGAAAGWLRGENPVRAPAPLVVVSRFAAFLSEVSPNVTAVIHLPASDETIVAAVRRAAGVADAAREPLRLPRDPFDDARDRALEARGLLRPALDAELTGVAALVARGLGVPMGLVTIVDSDWQSFAGQSGMPADLAIAGGTPRSWSFCQHAVRESLPLVVEDARHHPAFHGAPLVTLGVIGAYAGVPIEVDGLGPVGTVCALSDQPRPFHEAELATLQLAARLVGQMLSAGRRAPSVAGAPSTSLAPGDLLDDKYWITATLGEGGQGRVYLARDRMLGHVVAIKVGPPEMESLLLREAEALARLRHPNIVQLHGWGRTPSGEIYIVLEYVQGDTLESRIEAAHAAGEPLSRALVADVAQQIAGALASMHALGYVHGDVKPDNILLDATLDRAVLIDFGLGFALPMPGGPARSAHAGGTPGYSAPEQLADAKTLEAHPSFDIYALAAVVFKMLAGVGPFEGGEGGALGRQLRDDRTLLLALRPDLPGEVESILARALSVTPARRPDSPIAFAEALARALHAEAQPSEPRAAATIEPQSRGGVLHTMRAEVIARLGSEAEARLIDRLDAADREALAGMTDPNALYPAAPLVAYLRAYSGGDVAALEALGWRQAAEALRHAMRRSRMAWTPEALLANTGVLLARFHTWGRVHARRTGAGAQLVNMWLPEGFAPMMCSYLGGVLRALLGAAGHRATVVQRQCQARGASCCGFEVSWVEAFG